MLYLVRFNFDQQRNGEDDETGSFEVLIEADSPDEAVELCKPYLTRTVQQKPDAFAGKVALYIDNIFELKMPLSKPALINLRAHPADGFSEVMLGKLDGPPGVSTYGWDSDSDDPNEPFMTFGGAPPRIRMGGEATSRSAAWKAAATAKPPKPTKTSKRVAKPKR